MVVRSSFSDVEMLHDTLLRIHQDTDRLEVGPALLNDALTAWARLADAARLVAQVRDEFAAKLADAMGREKRVTVLGVGTFEKHRKTARKRWDTDDLVRVVLDTRTVDPETGETESPVDRLLRVWNLGAPRVTALRELGIEPDDYCESEKGALTLQVVTNG